ncbi:MAG: UDP-N-acetylglucosamine 2-epimerase (non-hydrolyzing) [Bacteroidales bacterium]|nr:UDP-N-acetylglucosamine 2-epimerase (non-hydrolyzing) [Bacteroidales bacterium]
MKVFLVAGARPNFMKIAPIYRASKKVSGVDCRVVHTGQHYDHEMSQAFFDDLEIPKPKYYLKAGSGTHAVQTAKIMVAFEKICEKERPDLVIVVGDVNSTLACSIVAKKLLIKVAHVEAGLRSFDLTMPEEINRMVTDSISDYLFVTEESGKINLMREGKSKKIIHFVGHVMIDNLIYQKNKIAKTPASCFKMARDLKPAKGTYAFMTLHRPSNVDDKKTFAGIAEALNEIAKDMIILFPVHPRTKKMMAKFKIKLSKNIKLLPPLGFKESLFLWKDAKVVLTDSGGLQEETTALKIPCVTIRKNTERPITIKLGTNILAGTSKEGILKAYKKFFNKVKNAKAPPLWDGKAAERIWDILVEREGGRG